MDLSARISPAKILILETASNSLLLPRFKFIQPPQPIYPQPTLTKVPHLDHINHQLTLLHKNADGHAETKTLQHLGVPDNKLSNLPAYQQPVKELTFGLLQGPERQ